MRAFFPPLGQDRERKKRPGAEVHIWSRRCETASIQILSKNLCRKGGETGALLARGAGARVGRIRVDISSGSHSRYRHPFALGPPNRQHLQQGYQRSVRSTDVKEQTPGRACLESPSNATVPGPSGRILTIITQQTISQIVVSDRRLGTSLAALWTHC